MDALNALRRDPMGVCTHEVNTVLGVLLLRGSLLVKNVKSDGFAPRLRRFKKESRAGLLSTVFHFKRFSRVALGRPCIQRTEKRPRRQDARN